MQPLLQPQPIESLHERSSRAEAEDRGPEFSRPIDKARWFVCPTLTPLYYAPVYRDLDQRHQRRYNQLTALCFNELIAFFEESFASSVLAAIAAAKPRSADERFVDCLHGFLRDERRHIAYWRRLNCLTEPGLYSQANHVIIRFSPFVLRSLLLLTRRPLKFPAVFWIMLALEERSLEISRRCLAFDRERIEPTYREVYAHHLRDEVRHVQLDWHLIEKFYATATMCRRRCTARLVSTLIGRFFLRPTRSAMRVVQRLVCEYPDLSPLAQLMVRQLRQVGDDPAYHEMMYSRKTTPLTFALFDRYEEMHRMRKVLHSYSPHQEGRVCNE